MSCKVEGSYEIAYAYLEFSILPHSFLLSLNLLYSKFCDAIELQRKHRNQEICQQTSWTERDVVSDLKEKLVSKRGLPQNHQEQESGIDNDRERKEPSRTKKPEEPTRPIRLNAKTKKKK